MKNSLPVILLKGICVLPYAELKIDLVDEQDVNIIDLAKKEYDGYVLLISPEDEKEEKIEVGNLPTFGLVGQVVRKTTLPNGCIRISIEGVKRTDISNYVPVSNMSDVFCGNLKTPTRFAIDKKDEDTLVRKVKYELEKYIMLVPYSSNSILSIIEEVNSISKLVDIIANYMPISFKRRLEYLKTNNPHTRVMMILEDLQRELDIFEIEKELDSKLKEKLDENQKEFVLREKLKLIKEELGDISNRDDDVESMKEKLSKIKASDKIIKKFEKEIKKYESTPSSSPEVGIIRNYLDVVLNLPWNKYTKETNDIKYVKNILDESHYGLVDVKDRIIEYIAVKSRSVSNKAPIICLVGPPGVGKTTLASSIAKSIKRDFVKISVGGVNDPAEIIGHRRTYMGANPGRIINALKKCGSSNPVFLIDEVDKMTKDIKGDPASALLEVLDPEQNDKFYDNYVEEPFDLSKVMFILTANYKEQIPIELKDRLEIIDLSCYTEYEKLFIAKEHLIKLACKEYNLTDKDIRFSDDIILKLIKSYTKEAGVRELDRVINRVVKKYVKNMIEDKKDSISVDVSLEDIIEFIGKEKYSDTSILSEEAYGVVNGLAYTQLGGDILPLEAVLYPSKDSIKLTGNLGKVMEESVNIALAHVKANAKKYKVDISKLDNNCIHLNAIEGAIPKDGPSAGTALTTTIISLLLEKKVNSKVGMTGEMTLTGKVLPIGGLKEKIIGAYASGVNKFYIPLLNERDINDIPKEVLNNITIKLVSNYEEIYNDLFSKKKKA